MLTFSNLKGFFRSTASISVNYTLRLGCPELRPQTLASAGPKGLRIAKRLLSLSDVLGDASLS